MKETTQLLDLTKTIAAGLFAGRRYPWEVLEDLSAYILKQLEEKKWKRVLFVPTGALLSKTSFNEGKTVPGIAHGVVIESV